MSAQRDQLARLRAEVTVLRELASLGAAPPACSSIPSPLPACVRAAVVKEASEDSAPSEASFRTELHPFARRAAPYAAIVAFAVAFQLKPAPRSAAGAPPPAPPAAQDDGADEALLLVHEWRLPGDERPSVERFDNGVRLPGREPAWKAEVAGERIYRVSYRASDDAPRYDFDVDLNARRVDPTPETADLLAPRLTARR